MTTSYDYMSWTVATEAVKETEEPLALCNGGVGSPISHRGLAQLTACVKITSGFFKHDLSSTESLWVCLLHQSHVAVKLLIV